MTNELSFSEYINFFILNDKFYITLHSSLRLRLQVSTVRLILNSNEYCGITASSHRWQHIFLTIES